MTVSPQRRIGLSLSKIAKYLPKKYAGEKQAIQVMKEMIIKRTTNTVVMIFLPIHFSANWIIFFFRSFFCKTKKPERNTPMERKTASAKREKEILKIKILSGSDGICRRNTRLIMPEIKIINSPTRKCVIASCVFSLLFMKTTDFKNQSMGITSAYHSSPG